MAYDPISSAAAPAASLVTAAAFAFAEGYMPTSKVVTGLGPVRTSTLIGALLVGAGFYMGDYEGYGKVLIGAGSGALSLQLSSWARDAGVKLAGGQSQAAATAATAKTSALPPRSPAFSISAHDLKAMANARSAF